MIRVGFQIYDIGKIENLFNVVSAGFADKVEVQLAYAIGIADPVSVSVETFGTEKQDVALIERYIRENYDLTPRGIIERLRLLDMRLPRSAN